ncbi:hypothetical protein FH608_048310 [Nonomuraea phyllanthi]|uniref:Uncharacterized protein n=1 Tax=Nonomuraea phyllanthi TaxID=2219224 RepID=A0A5C4V0Y6_9ACTN|nr:hypothetical protein [Nonomuraea phyllanthi]KAB8184299.1 hypothetical protein FH608_048310 [Nonomuraea phyllanthi]
METDRATGAREQLDLLRVELARRGWHADQCGTEQRPFLRVRNRADPELSDSVACRGGVYCWSWGPAIGAVDDVSGTADRITHVLRVIL